MAWYSWSRTAASNASADGTINWAEGQAPSSVNDSARAMMAATAKYRDDIAGAIVTAGTSTAYTVSSFSAFDTLAHLSGQTIAFTPHATNGATVTLNVDSLGAKPLRSAPNSELLAGVLITGTPYVALYNNSDGAFYLQGFYGNPYNVPLASGLDFWGSVAPNSSFAFPTGQAISRTTYATLFAIMGTTYGVGDGSTTFNLPDKTGRVSAMKEATATRLTTAGGGVDGGTIGSAGGTQTKTLLRSDLPNVSATVAITDPGHTHTYTNPGGASAPPGSGGSTCGAQFGTATSSSTTGITAAVNLNGNVTQTVVNGLPPLIVCNYILRVV